MSFSRNQIIKNARKFSKDWKDETSEKAESQTFWNEFFAVFGISRRQVGIFEAKLTKLNGNRGFIDVFWAGKLVCEQKSRGQDLDKAFHQAIEYLEATAKVAPEQLPRYVIVCDFEFLRLYDLDVNTHTEIRVEQLSDHIHLFGFLHDQVAEIKQAEEAANIEAAEKMGKLHDQLKAIGYDGHALQVILIRLLFCLFAEDTGIFAKYQFTHFIQRKTKTDGSDLAAQLSHLFHVLNQPENQRLKNLDADLAEFAYINGQLFSEFLPPASFDDEMRALLLEACEMDWSKISPEIFGALFQSVMNQQERRSLGAHYTSEDNILKVISSLFMDDLRSEFDEIRKKGRGKARIAALDAFHEKLSNLDFLDPACGCGNFLIVAYRELRLLELDVIEEIYKKDQLLNVETIVRCNVSQFHGIEIDEFPAQIARVAMWLADHQMNMLVSQHYGTHFARIPLKASADIQNDNALEIMWAAVDYIFGNPPFLGKNYQTAQQKQSLARIAYDVLNAASLDFVAAWYIKAAKMMKDSPNIKTAFVSTNSITQGEQVITLWNWMLEQNVTILFAHQTFAWQSAAKGKAAVHCVIVGFGVGHFSQEKYLFSSKNEDEIIKTTVDNINPYLVAGKNTIIQKRTKPLCNVSKMVNGSKPTDGGNLLLSEAEYQELISKEPLAQNWIRPFSMGEEFINNIPRYCLWLVDCPPKELKKMPLVLRRVQAVKEMRLASTKIPTQKLADIPSHFAEIRQPHTSYIALPRVSSERRFYIPVGFMPATHVAGDKLQMIPDATLYEFGMISSVMHNAWSRVVSGRLKSDYQYSALITYNNFPFPQNINDEEHRSARKQAIEVAAQAVLDARAKYPESSLADLYDPLLMPADLLKAHKTLDKAVDAAYGQQKFANEAERVAYLFELYEQYTKDEKAESPKLKAKK
jgi:type I restriction-modification system DNA methylase subunit